MQTETQTLDQITTLTADLGAIKTDLGTLLGLKSTLATLQAAQADLALQLGNFRTATVAKFGSAAPHRTRPIGGVTDECAAQVASQFILHCERSGAIDALCSAPATQRDTLLNFARNTLNLSTKAALTTTDIPLPAQYGNEIRELISDFGVVRRRMSPYPIGTGTCRPVRMGTRPAFGSIAISAAFAEKSPTVTLASLESHKIGGVIRLPREIDEQAVIPIGRFLTRYAAVEFARAEDTWGFLADGTPETYENVEGIATIAKDKGHVVTLAAGKTKPSDATLDDFRLLRTKVNKAALNGRLSAYYLDTTWETHLGSFNTQAEPHIYQRLPDGSAILDGYPIVWTDVLQPFDTLAAAGKTIAVFGALSFWWMGEHGTPRIDTSTHIWFSNDQLAVRFIEEIDFDYCAEDATAALLTAAAA
ncbi:MAG TPA: phage major capsid protein [Verrucomicrobiae bacterium]|nr:phage major capsid protein [Verrucomicrobiae bacterium]